MLLALIATVIVVLALISDLIAPRLLEQWERYRARRHRPPAPPYDPGRERRAEHKARALLQSCVNEEEWAMYRDLGFIRVWGTQMDSPGRSDGTGGAAYGYLIYPHKPIVAYLVQTHRLLNEYCVTFPDSDDVLAKWMALTGDERRLIATANMHLPGRQVDPEQIKRDLWRLTQWERARLRDAGSQATSTTPS